MTISSSGVGSGLDVATIVSQLMSAESAPLTALATKEAKFQSQLSAFGTLKGSVSSFQTAMRGLSLSKFQTLTASSADTAVYTASASSSAQAGSYSVEVQRLAAAQKVASAAFTNVTDTVGTGTLTFQFGTTVGGVFTANANKATQVVTIATANSSLSGVRDAINAAKIGVTASILNNGTGNKLVITSNDTGAANSLKITVSDTTDVSNIDNAGLSQLAYDPAGALNTGKNLTETVTAVNATLVVDGVTGISKASNTVTDVIPGVTLNLLKTSVAATPATLTVARDTASVKTAVADFVKGYNDLNSAISGLTSYNSTTKQAAVLLGDVGAQSIITQARRTLNSALTGIGGAYTLLSDVGVSFQKDGTLKLDSTKLQTAIDTNFDSIAAIFATQGKPTDSLVSYVTSTDKTTAGSYALSISQLATNGTLSGVTTASLAHTSDTFTVPVTIDANNNTFSLKVNGVQSGTITLTQGTYTTGTALASQIQSWINGDTALKAVGATATVTFDTTTSLLKITSNAYGTSSNVEITAVGTTTAATLGLSVAAGTAGVNVAGTINGSAGTPDGQYLVGPTGTAVEGLKLQITGGAIGSRGTVNFSKGYATQLDKLVDNLLGANGPLTSRTTGINSSITSIGKQRDVLNKRLAILETRYRAQFTALDSIVSQLKSTSAFLTSQLASLSAK